MKPAKLQREFGRFLLEASAYAHHHRNAHWFAQEDGGEPCKCVGVMVFLDDEGLPAVPGFVLETLDGRRVYTTPYARVVLPAVQ